MKSFTESNRIARRFISFIPLFVAFSAPVQSVSADVSDQQLIKQSRSAIKDLGSSLKATLQSSMKSNGPIESLSVCKIEAPKIAKGISNDSMSVSRTSLKTRNRANNPDEWEKSVLIAFEEKKRAGQDIKGMDYSETVTRDGKEYFRYMKAIPTARVCTVCHGTEMNPKLVSKIDELYPYDRARDFKAGDIRGAFSVIIKK